MIKGLLLDLSGTLYVGDQALPGAREAIRLVERSGLPVRYVTNTSRSTRRTVFARLQTMGFPIAEEQIFTAPLAVRQYLRSHRLRPWLLVHPNLKQEFADLPQQDPNAVVLGDAADGFSYANLNRAFRLVLEGAPLLAVGNNRYFLEPDGMSLDAGPFLRALEYAADTRAIILGKPATAFFHTAVKSLNCQPREALMVGDDVLSDVNGALNAGLQAALVQTGKYRSGDENHIDRRNGRVCRDLREAIETALGRR